MFEHDYVNLVQHVLLNGEERTTRNGKTLSIFNSYARIIDLQTGNFPILLGRKMVYKGVLGELAAILRKPTCNGDFVEQGCNYWSKFADEDGSLRVDYGNSWFNFEGFDQVAELKRQLREDPTSRRMIISGWNPANLDNLSLPCCHMMYQFYVSKDNRLHMKWHQRSVDVMVGLPSDAIFAAAWLLAICNEFGFAPGIIHMDFGDTHIYEEHLANAVQYVKQAKTALSNKAAAKFHYSAQPGADFCSFVPSDLEVLHYDPEPMLSFELKV